MHKKLLFNDFVWNKNFLFNILKLCFKVCFFNVNCVYMNSFYFILCFQSEGILFINLLKTGLRTITGDGLLTITILFLLMTMMIFK